MNNKLAIRVISAVIVLAVGAHALDQIQDVVGPAHLNEIINFNHMEELTQPQTARMEIESIELRSLFEFSGDHWILRYQVTEKNADNTVKKKHDLVSDLSNRASGLERFTTYNADLQVHGSSDYVDTTITRKMMEAANGGKPFTLGRVMKCATAAGLQYVSGKCFIYAYRVLRFVTGQCKCGECVTGSGDPNPRKKDGKKSPLHEMQKLVAEDKKAGLAESFKDQVKKWPDVDPFTQNGAYGQ